MMISGVASTIYMSRIVDEVNRHRAAAEQDSPYGWYATKILRILDEYRQVCPTGRLRNRYLVTIGAGLVGFVVAVISFGIFG
jgi:hypothetical protein